MKAGIQSLVDIQGRKNELFASKIDKLPTDISTMTKDEIKSIIPEMNIVSLLNDTQSAIPSDIKSHEYTNILTKITGKLLEAGQNELTKSLDKCGFGESRINMMNEFNRQKSIFINPIDIAFEKTKNTMNNVKDLCKGSFSQYMPNCQNTNAQLNSFDLTLPSGVEGMYNLVLDNMGIDLNNLNPNIIGDMDIKLNTTNTKLLSDLQDIVNSNLADFPELAAKIIEVGAGNLSDLPESVDGQNELFKALQAYARSKPLGTQLQVLANTALKNYNVNMGELTETAAVMDKIKYSVDRVLSDTRQLQDLGIISPAVTEKLQNLSSLAGGGPAGAVTELAKSGLLGPGGKAAAIAAAGGAEGIFDAMQPDENGILPEPPDVLPEPNGGLVNMSETSTNFEALTTGAATHADEMVASGDMGPMQEAINTSSDLQRLSATASQSTTSDVMSSIETMSSMNMPVMKGMSDIAINSMYLMAAIASTHSATLPHMFSLGDITSGPIFLCPMPRMIFIAPEHGIHALPLIIMNMGYAPLVLGATCDNKRFRIGNTSLSIPFIGMVGMLVVSFLGGPNQNEDGILTLKTNAPATPTFVIQLKGVSFPRSMLMDQII